MMNDADEGAAPDPNTWRCDKCQQAVPPDNDAVLVAIYAGMGAQLITAQPRHFLPTAACAGSPSRAQYLAGQPRDSRYPYVDAVESAWREAWEAVQRGAHAAD